MRAMWGDLPATPQAKRAGQGPTQIYDEIVVGSVGLVGK